MLDRNHHARGYTLIEILVVIVIIGLLTTMATVSYNKAQLTARDNTRKTNVITLAHAVEQYYSVNKKLPGKQTSTLDGSTTNTSFQACEKVDAQNNYLYRYNVVAESNTSCNKLTYTPLNGNDKYSFNATDWTPFPVWIPGLGSYINPFPTEPSMIDGDSLIDDSARTYAYRHLSNGFMIYSSLETTSASAEDKYQYSLKDTGNVDRLNSTCGTFGLPTVSSSTTKPVIYAVCQ